MDFEISNGGTPALIKMVANGAAVDLSNDSIHPNIAGDLLFRNKLRAMLVTLKASYFATP